MNKGKFKSWEGIIAGGRLTGKREKNGIATNKRQLSTNMGV